MRRLVVAAALSLAFGCAQRNDLLVFNPIHATAGAGGAGEAAPSPLPPAPPTAADVLRGSCATTTAESKLLPATILFVLDRSGSMACNPPPITASAICEQTTERVDPSAPSKWEVTTDALLRAIAALPENTEVGLSYFSNDDRCGVYATPDVPIAPNTLAQQQILARSTQDVKPAGGTPVVGATISAYAHLHERALTGPPFVVLITDGAQSEQCSFEPRCSDAASCVRLLLDEEVPKAAGPGAGIRTFAIGVPGSEPARATLSQIALRGGTAPNGCDPAQGQCHFDMSSAADLSAALRGALADIAGHALDCELALPAPDASELDLARVNVVYTPGDGSEPNVVPQDAAHSCGDGSGGWQYAEGIDKIRLCGAICDTVRADSRARVDVVLGCPVVLL